MKRPHPLGTLARWVIVLLAFAVIGIPLLYTLASAFKEGSEVLLGGFFPRRLFLGNFQRVLADPIVFRSFFNSILISAIAVMEGSLLSLFASVPVVRRKERIFKAGYAAFLASMIIPSISGLIPLYVLMAKLGMLDKPIALGVVYGIGALPFGILVFASFLKTVPLALEESAMLDGCGYFRRIGLIVMPLVKAPLFSVIALQLPGVWNDFLMPMLFLRGKDHKTFTLLIYNYLRDHEADYGAIFALMVLGMALPILFYLFARREIDRSIGSVAGGVKG